MLRSIYRFCSFMVIGGLLCGPFQVTHAVEVNRSQAFSFTSTTSTPSMLISALHYWGYESNADEAVQITNVSTQTIQLDGNWKLYDQANHELAFPARTMSPGERWWIANNGMAFARQFGFTPTLMYSEFAGTPLSFANTGGSVRLAHTQPITLDSANADGGAWEGGVGGPSYISMERIDAGAPDTPSNWASAVMTAPLALDSAGRPITGTPHAKNSVAITPSVNFTMSVVINEVAWAGTQGSFSHEWIELYNNTAISQSLFGWQIVISGSGSIPLEGVIGPHDYFVVQRNAATFSSGASADQTYNFPALSNNGATLFLMNPQAEWVDTLVYGIGSSQPGWQGAPLQPYTVTQAIPADGQVLMRKLDPQTNLPIGDSDTAQDWMNDRADLVEGRKPIYPGWAWAQFQRPARGEGALVVAVAPDSSFDLAAQTLAQAQTSIDLAAYTFDQPHIGELLADKIARGVQVRVLLDGAPAGGLGDQTRWICQQLAIDYPRSGCWFMRSDAGQNIHARYANLHAKFAIIDHRMLLLGSENFGINGLPDDDKGDGTAGHRGVLVRTDAVDIVTRARQIFSEDISTAHGDITQWCNSAICAPYGPPGVGFAPTYVSGGMSYTVRYTPLALRATAPMTLATSPESHLRASNSILSLLAQAKAGDEIIMEQLDEPFYWGTPASNPQADPNLRLQAALQAAQRGATLRVVLDSFYDQALDVRSNVSTTRYLLAQAAVQGLDVRAVVANPSALGIHNKLILARIGGQGYAQIGSWNGSETSAKRNREMSLLVESNDVYDYLRRLVLGDLALAMPTYLPVVLNRYETAVIPYPLVSEIMVNPAGLDEGREWIEIYNPSPIDIDLSGYKIGDAPVPTSTLGDGMVAFPAGYVLRAHQVIVIAQNAAQFKTDNGLLPTFELADYDPTIPELPVYTAWATGTISLANAGDEVVLLGPDDHVVDGVAWGVGVLPGNIPYTGTVFSGHTLQRWPYDWDTDNGTIDWRDQSIPSVGLVP